MKKRLHGKKAGIAILVALIIISLIDVIFRAVVMGELSFTTSNFGEQFAVIVLAATILIMNAKGKDRICYICFAFFIGFFVLEQFVELPGMIFDFIHRFGMNGIGTIGVTMRILSMVTICAIGVLLVEYLNDGTIYNKAFNTLCVSTIVFIVISICISIYASINIDTALLLDVFNNIYRLIMVFLTAFFAYDSAKHQLKKTKLSK